MRSLLLSSFLLFSLFSQAQSKKLVWEFPLPRVHTGILLGNGLQGLIVWGDGNQLNITVGRAGFWDHRGGNEFSARTTFQEVRKMLEAKDEAALRKAFEVPRKTENQPSHPFQIGGGRLEIKLPEGWTLLRGELLFEKGDILIFAKNSSGVEKEIRVAQAVDNEIAWLSLPKELEGNVGAKLIPSYDFPDVKKELEKTGVKPPNRFISDANTSGFTQHLPDDAPLTIFTQTRELEGQQHILIASFLGENGKQAVEKKIGNFRLNDVQKTRADWWTRYWSEVPKVNLPDPILQEIVDYGLFKQACATSPQGLPCALQGVFMEEHRLPPWSNDYHFNINIQMIYTPVLATNRLSHLDPLWKMLEGWMPRLQENGEKFFGRKGALMLPHAVDDRCQVVGTFWTGTIDHACTAWMAYLAWQHFQYGQDKAILEKTAWPLLVGAFEGYWAMLEEVDDGKGGKRFSLPVSVSPEYGGDGMNAWGRDASFQLAALHCIADILPQAAHLLGQPNDPRWADIARRLPPYSLVNEQVYDADPWYNSWLRQPHIGLWQGKELDDSHRHHSHLGGIYPFVTIDPKSPEHEKIVDASLNQWTFKGMGAWSGWCVPWASIIHGRNDNAEAAVALLHYWQAHFVNAGRGTLHNSNKRGLSLISNPVYEKLPTEPPPHEVMQLDAGFGALSAVLELLVQNRADGIHVLPGLHYEWKNLSFENILCEGAFFVSAVVNEGVVQEVKVTSKAGGKLRLAHGLGERFLFNGKEMQGKMFEKECVAEETLVLKRL
jgi:hypothetical protein